MKEKEKGIRGQVTPGELAWDNMSEDDKMDYIWYLGFERKEPEVDLNKK